MRFDEAAAWQKLKTQKRIRVAKGQRILEFGVDGAFDRQEVLAAVMGPSGNLRAPTFIRGEVGVVGFHAELYAEVFPEK